MIQTERDSFVKNIFPFFFFCFTRVVLKTLWIPHLGMAWSSRFLLWEGFGGTLEKQ